MIPAQNGIDRKVTVSFHGNIALLTIDRGEDRLNPSFFDAMQNALDEVESIPDAQVLVVTGKGKFFSNGIDLDYVKAQGQKDGGEDFGTEFGTRLFRLLARIAEFPLITVAAINGHAFAGGALMALAFDYRVMNNEKGWFCINEVHLGLGIPPYLQEIARLKIPSPMVFMEALVLGRRYTGQEAKEHGIVQEISSQAELVHTAAIVGKRNIPKNGFNRKFLHNSKLNVFGLKIRPLKDSVGMVKSLL